jgi:hypothetical protein
MAEAESSEGKARDERMAFLGQVAESILKQDTQAAYEQGLAVIRREFPDMHVPMSAVYNKADVQQVADMGVSARLRLGQQHAGLTPIYGTDAQGKPVMGRMTQTGFEQIQLPPGFTLTPGLQKYDTGTELLAVDRGGNVVSRIPKEVREAAAEQAGGTVEGKEAAERPAKMRQAQSSIASLDRQHSRVLDMLDRAEDLVDRGWTTGLMAKPMSALPSDAKALAGVIRSIQANLGITELQALKGAGVSLGQVTEAEHALLQRLYGELEQAQSAEDVRRTLSDFRRELHAAQRERQAAYDRDFGGERAPHGSTGRRSSAQAPAAGSSAKVITREQARQLADKRGVSVEQVLQDAAAAGYGIR